MADDINPYAATVASLYGGSAPAEPTPAAAPPRLTDMDGTDLGQDSNVGPDVREPSDEQLQAQGLDQSYRNPKTGKVSAGVPTVATDAEPQPAAQPADSSNPYAATVARLYPKDDQADDTTSTWMAWRARNPQLDPGPAADVLRYAEASGKPVDFVAKNLDAVRGSVDASKVDLAALADTHPALHQWLGTQGLRVDAAKDDLGPLTQLEDAIHAPHVGEALRDAFREQVLTYDEVKDFATLGGPENEKEITGLEQQLAGAEKDYGATSVVGRAMVGTAKMAPMVVGDMIARALGKVAGTAAGRLAGAGAGAAAGLAEGGAPAAPGAAAGGAVGGAGGGLVGSELASGTFNSYQILGPLHRELQKVRGPNGERLDPDVERFLAENGAVLGGGLTAALGGPIGNRIAQLTGGTAVRELADRGLVEALRGELQKGGTISMLNRLARRWGAHEVSGATVMALQSAVSDATAQAGGMLTGGEFDSRRLMSNTAHSFIQGLQDMPLMAAAHAVGETRADERDRAASPMRAALEEKGQQVASAQGQDRLQALISAAKASKSAQGMPAEVRELVKGSAEHPNGVDAAYIHRDAFDQLAQAAKVEPAELARAVFGSSEPYAKAAEGGDLAVPIEDYVSAVKDHGAIIDQLAKEDTRLYQPDRSPREQREVTEGLQKRAEELAKAAPEDMADEQRQVYEDFRAKAEAAGRDGQEADGNAKLVAAAMQSWAERFQKNGSKATALDLYRMQDLSIVGPRGQGAEPQSIQELRKRYAGLPEDEQKASLYVDRLTGLHTERGYEARAADPSRPFTTEVQVAQGKSINDHKELGHDAGDAALKVFAQVLRDNGISDGARRGNTVSFDSASKDDAQQLVERMREALGNDQVVTNGTIKAQDGEGAADRLQRAQFAHEDRRKAGRADKSVPERDQPLTPEQAKGLGQVLANPRQKGSAAVTPAHEADFEQLARDRDLFTEANLTPEGLLNENGFRLAVDHLKANLKPGQKLHFLSADVRGVSKLNDAFSEGLAREDRLKPVDEIMSEAAKHIAKDKRAKELLIARPHGDEFYAVHVGGDAELKKLRGFFADMDDALSKRSFYREVGDEVVYVKGLRVAFGTGETFKQADQKALPDAKSEQKELIEPERSDAKDWERVARALRRGKAPEPVRVGKGLREGLGGDGSPPGGAGSGGGGGPEGGGAGGPDSGPPRGAGGLGGEEAGGQDAGGQRANDGHAPAAGEVGEPLYVAPGVAVHFTAEVPTEEAMTAAGAFAETLRSPERRAAVQGYLRRVREYLAGRKMQTVAGDMPRDLEVRLANEFGITDPLYGTPTTEDLQHQSRGGERKRRTGASGNDAVRQAKALEFKRRLAKTQDELDNLSQPTFTLESKRGRGSITFSPPEGGKRRRFSIELLRGADPSTLAHETAHFLGEVMGDLAQRPDAPPELKDDYAGLLKFMGYDSHEDRQAARAERAKLKTATGAADQRRLTALTAKEEKLSHAWEQYLMEGKTPSVALAGTFARFRNWMVRIYRNIRSLQGGFVQTFGDSIGLTDDVRRIFDRLLASTDEVERMQKAQSAQPFREPFADATPEERAAAEKQWAQAQEEASSEVLRLVIAEDKKESGPYFKDELQRFRDEVNGELDEHPVYRAIKAFQESKEKLDRAGAVRELGAEFVQDIAKKHPRLFAKKGEPSIHVDVAAGLHGFESGGDMLRAMQAAEPRRALVERQATERLRNLYGPTLLENAKALDEVALAALHNPEAMRAALIEHRRLAAMLDPDQARKLPPVDEETLRRHAQRLAAKLPVGKIVAGDEGAAGGYRRAERVAAERMRKAYEDGKVNLAVGFNLDRLLNMALWREAKDARERLETQRELLRKATAEAWQTTLGKADVAATEAGQTGDRAYRGATNALLQAVGVMATPPGGIDKSQFEALVASVGHESLGDVPALRELLDNPTPWKQLTQDEAGAVHDAVKSIRHAAGRQVDFEVEGKRIDKAQLFAEMSAIVAKSKLLPPGAFSKSSRTAGEIAATALRSADAWLTPMDRNVDELDAGDPNGPAGRVLKHERMAARDVLVRIDTKITAKVLERIEGLDKAIRDRAGARVPGLPELLPIPDRFKDRVRPPETREELWTLFLNAGNKDNLQRLRDGNGWSEDQVGRALQLLSPKEAEFLQGLLDDIESLHPDLARVYEARTGLPLGKVDATPIKVHGKDYRGGYFPIRYHADIDRRGVVQLADVEKMLFPQGLSTPSVFSGHTKSRVERVDAPLSMDFGTVGTHMAQVAHDIAMGDWVRRAGAFVMDQRFQDLASRRLGVERTKLLSHWLRDIANDRAGSSTAAASGAPGMVEAGMAAARSLAISGVMTLNLPSTLAHLTDALVAVGDAQGIEAKARRFTYLPDAYLKAVAAIKTGPREEWKLSKELRFRESREIANVRKELAKIRLPANSALRGVVKVRSAVDHVAMMTRHNLDVFHARVLFQMGYEEGKDRGMEDDEAARHADELLSRTLPSGDIAEKSQLLRSKNGFGQIASVLYSYANKMYGLFVHAPLARARDSGWSAASVGDLAATWLTMAAIEVAGGYLGGRRKDEDDERARLFGEAGTAGWVARRALLAPINTLPILGMAVEQLVDGREVSVRTAPEAQLVQDSINRLGKVWDRLNNGDASDDDWWSVLEGATAGTLGVYGQGRRTFGYLDAVRHGDIAPANPLEALGGLVYGAPRK